MTAFDTVLYDANRVANGYRESMLSIPHMLVVFVIVLVVFGPQKLPELARSLGKLLAEFRKASADFKGAFEEEMKDLERQARDVERKKAAEAAATAANEAPVQAATFATPAGTETPAVVAEGDSELAGNTASEVFADASPDAFGDAIDARVTEGTAELVVKPSAESVARSSPDAVDVAEVAEGKDQTLGPETVSETIAGAASERNSENTSAAIKIDVPHDQQPA